MRKLLLGLLVVWGLILMESSAFADIKLVGSLNFGKSDEVVVEGNYVYASGQGAVSIYIIDVSNPFAPNLIYTLSMSASVSCLEKDGNYLYAGVGNDVKVIDVQNPLAPSIVGSYSAGNSCVDIDVDNSIACVKVGSDLLILDVSTPSNPTFLSRTNNLLSSELEISGNYVYAIKSVAGGYNLNVIDISNPSSPSVVYSLPGFNQADDLAISGNYLFTDDGTQFAVVDISNPVLPTIVTSVLFSAGCEEIRPAGNSLYIGENQLMEVFDITNSTTPTFVENFSYPEMFKEIKVQGNLGYVAVDNSGLIILDLQAPPNQPPIANAGPNIKASVNDIVTLDASNSYDPDGTIINYKWMRRPSYFSNYDNIYFGANPTTTVNALGRCEEMMELEVTDDAGEKAKDSMIIINKKCAQKAYPIKP